MPALVWGRFLAIAGDRQKHVPEVPTCFVIFVTFGLKGKKTCQTVQQLFALSSVFY